MIRSILIAGAGGFIGTVLRYLTGLAASRWINSAWPWGTFIVNIIGCFIIGAAMTWTGKNTVNGEDWRLFLATGICGGFTTFSAFAQENLRFLQSGNHLAFLTYTAASVMLGVLAVALGVMVTRG